MKRQQFVLFLSLALALASCKKTTPFSQTSDPTDEMYKEKLGALLHIDFDQLSSNPPPIVTDSSQSASFKVDFKNFHDAYEFYNELLNKTSTVTQTLVGEKAPPASHKKIDDLGDGDFSGVIWEAEPGLIIYNFQGVVSVSASATVGGTMQLVRVTANFVLLFGLRYFGNDAIASISRNNIDLTSEQLLVTGLTTVSSSHLSVVPATTSATGVISGSAQGVTTIGGVSFSVGISVTGSYTGTYPETYREIPAGTAPILHLTYGITAHT